MKKHANFYKLNMTEKILSFIGFFLASIGAITFLLTVPHYRTGIQFITVDINGPIIWIGFFSAILGTLIIYFANRRFYK